MDFLRKAIWGIVVLVVILVGLACFNNNIKEKFQEIHNVNIIYDAKLPVDKVFFTLGDFYIDITGKRNNKVKQGHESNIYIESNTEIELAINIINEGKTIFALVNERLDLSNGNNFDLKIVDDKNGGIDIEILQKKKI